MEFTIKPRDADHPPAPLPVSPNSSEEKSEKRKCDDEREEKRKAKARKEEMEVVDE